METRLAFAANLNPEVQRHLADFVSRRGEGGWHCGNVENANPAVAMLVSGEEGRQFLEATIRNRAFDKLARLWTAGIEVDWALLHADPRPRTIALPGYPFAR